jgi:cell division protease FtsH
VELAEVEEQCHLVKVKQSLCNEDQVKVTFKDVAGVEEAKEEVKELVDFLRGPW